MIDLPNIRILKPFPKQNGALEMREYLDGEHVRTLTKHEVLRLAEDCLKVLASEPEVGQSQD